MRFETFAIKKALNVSHIQDMKDPKHLSIVILSAHHLVGDDSVKLIMVASFFCCVSST